MPIFQMILHPSANEPHETLQFIAANISAALTFANNHQSPHPAELWQDGVRVCKLVFSEKEGAWSVAASATKAKAN